MDNNEEKEVISGEVIDEGSSPKNQRPKQPKIGKLFLIALVGGLLGGGIAFGGYAAYQNYESTTVTGENEKGTAKISNIKVNVSTQSTTAFNKIKNAVVSVEAYSKSSSSSSLDDLFGDSSSGETTSESEGSGVIYKKTGDTAFIVTNNHVISGADKVKVLLNSGKKLSATVVGHDSVTDLAVLKINAADVTQVATFGNSNNISVGQTALAIGSPLGSTYATTLTQGIISAKKRTIETTDSDGVSTGQTTVIQTDAAINPGNSGGPLVNLDGQVVGINSMKLTSTGTSSTSSSTSVEGMGFAIPSNEVVKIINLLVKDGKIKRPALGISLINLSYVSTSEQKSALKLPSSVTSGVVVIKVSKNSPAKAAGLQKYDVITSLGGKKVKGLSSLRTALYSHKLGDTVQIQYYRDGTLKTANLKLTLEANDSNTTTASNSGN
ncbi:S1C family serine protease [Liquorilactobacillus cacaonum]|uniref:Endopeptidase n=1 Tax=Liquorilactobacillus cacaonum DSM 21116 TaxID=1423729 RepID=A0A0R2CM06_9LACO|nr:trypsin-like peptidase domain-containing protein [Liquorilactobacillus cacaonum]KRM92669.1 endopeptidase [Liquorilactobacillus cacaonum DSM 21116]